MVVCRLIACTLAVVVATPSASLGSQAKPKKGAKPKFPEWNAVRATLVKQLRQRRGYRGGDILSRSDVERVLNALAKDGWKVADRKQILGQTLPDNDYLVQQLRTPRGTTFMRKVSANRGTYDRLDRLRRLPLGKRRIPELINNPGGHTLILYMVGTPGGKNLGRYLNQTRKGGNFNQSTGRLYNGRALLQRLKISYSAEVKKRAKKPAPKPKGKKVRAAV